jgi:hypothetical protein
MNWFSPSVTTGNITISKTEQTNNFFGGGSTTTVQTPTNKDFVALYPSESIMKFDPKLVTPIIYPNASDQNVANSTLPATNPTLWDNISSGFGSDPISSIGNAAKTSGTAIVNSLSNTGSALSALGGSLLSGDVNKVGTAASNLVSNLAATVMSPLAGLTGILDKPLTSQAAQQLQANANPNMSKSASDANSKFKSLSSAQIKVGEGKTQLFSIGSPCRFNNTIDPQGRISAYLRTKMQVIDLIPCDYKFNFDALKGLTTAKNAAFGGIHSISYDERIAEYNRMCTFHGLQRKNNKTGDDVQWGKNFFNR